MSGIIKDAKQLLDAATRGPWVVYTRSFGVIDAIGPIERDPTEGLDVDSGSAELAAAAPELAQALAEETYEYQIQTRSQRMPTWLAITDDTLQKWYPEDKYNEIIREGRVFRGGAGFEMRVLRRRVSPPEVINE